MLSHHLLSFLLLILPVCSLDLTSRCSSSFAPDQCPCSRRHTPSLDFCLIQHSLTSCRQRSCTPHYVCDCSGDTLCRAAPVRSVLKCNSGINADGSCLCDRHIVSEPSQHHVQLIPLRPYRHMQSIDVLKLKTRICTEKPAFWASHDAAQLLQHNWHLVASPSREAPVPNETPVLRFGHPGHAVTFTSPRAVSATIPHVYPAAVAIDSDLVDPHRTAAVNLLTAECLSAVINVQLATHGIPTRQNIAVSPFDVRNRMVLKQCHHLPSDNPAIGMTIANLLQRATLATGSFPIHDAAISHQHVHQACAAINRNFEACEVDSGCVAIID